MTRVLVIGGLIVGKQLFTPLIKAGYCLEFIDINQYIAPFTLESLTKNLATKIGLAPVIIIGYSTGGLLAINLAYHYPDLVVKVILINSTPKFIGNESWLGITPIKFASLVYKLERYPLNSFICHFLRLANWPSYNDLEDLTALVSKYCNKDTIKNWLQLIKSIDLRMELSLLNQPLYNIVGENDILIPANPLNYNHIKQITINEANHINIVTKNLISIWSELITNV